MARKGKARTEPRDHRETNSKTGDDSAVSTPPALREVDDIVI